MTVDMVAICSESHWGINCSLTCNSNCYNNECHPVTGSCSLGCIEGYQLPNCTLACDKVNYGRNCSLNCSVNCVNQECNATDGSCSCLAGYEGSTCQQRIGSSDSSTDSVGVIVGSVVAALVVIIIIFSIVIIWRRKRTPNYKKEFQDNGHHNIVVLDNLKDEQYTLTPKKIRINEEDKEQSNPYIEIPEDFAADTMMAVGSLNTYMKSKDAEFYKKQFERIPQAGNVTQDIGLSKENKHKNRYKNICPYDHSRVHLEINTDQNELDYINASYIRGFNDEVNFIATQGPQKSTISDFIRMLWEQRIDIVVMLTDLVEETKVKCEKYWPDSGKIRVGQIKVNLGSTQVFADYTIRKLELFKKGEASHSFTQFHFTSWPDKGVPSTQWSLVDVEQRVASIPTKRPIVVHCSAGVGRTGTFIALYNIMRQAEETGLVDFFKTVSKLREDRIFMVQTSSQYEFLHKAAQVAIACMKTTVHAHDFSDRLNVLERQHILGSTMLETEFNSLCAVVDRSEQNFQDEFNVYENESKNKIDSDYELEHETKTNAKNNFLFLPGYKQRDQHILTKIPSTSEEALTLWKFVVDYCVSLIVAFDIDLNSQCCVVV
ncbi:receptor-type tyrosine-protein phosphatase S-like [Biomphalaria glabrata]|uniref:protein-tyrosine-phosphatase n=1 Tax=Biomphalaria glabrata TaxID=6526 RepID=A0A9W3ABZ3_BIOGL|nr:receptor-type tyrosine-protein phosphatase S-like [Biomphalaria glabrata]